MAARFINSPGVNLNTLATLASLQEQNKLAARNRSMQMVGQVVQGLAGVAGAAIQGYQRKKQQEYKTNWETTQQKLENKIPLSADEAGSLGLFDENGVPMRGFVVPDKPQKTGQPKQIFGGRYFDPSTQKVIELRHTQTDDGWATDRIESDLGFTPPDVIQRQRSMAGDLTEAEQKQFAAIQSEIDAIYEGKKDRKKRPTISKAEARTMWMNAPDPTRPGKKRGDRLSPALKNLVLTTGIVDITPQPQPSGYEAMSTEELLKLYKGE